MEFTLMNGRVYHKGAFTNANIGIEEGKIVSVQKGKIEADNFIDCQGKTIIPGAIDLHVHFRIPGFEKKEDWETGSRAVAKGGVTTVVEMPNTSPATTTVELLREKKNNAKNDSLVNFGFYFGAANDNEAEMKKAEGVAGLKVFMGSSTGNLLIDDLDELEKVFKTAKFRGLITGLHAEDERIIKANTEKLKHEKGIGVHGKIRDVEAETRAIEKAFMIQENIGNRMHFCHISTARGVELIEAEKKKGKTVSCEVAPHHLFLNELDLKKLKNFGKMNPPLRRKEDNRALWDALNKGTIDCLATDHAPHLVEEKEKDYWSAPSGVPGVETMLPLMIHASNNRLVPLERVVQACSENPAKIFGIKGKGRIEKDFDADLVVVDLARTARIRNEELETKCGWSPFNGWKLKGAIEKTFVNGRLVYDNGEIVDVKERGKEAEFYG